MNSNRGGYNPFFKEDASPNKSYVNVYLETLKRKNSELETRVRELETENSQLQTRVCELQNQIVLDLVLSSGTGGAGSGNRNTTKGETENSQLRTRVRELEKQMSLLSAGTGADTKGDSRPTTSS